MIQSILLKNQTGQPHVGGTGHQALPQAKVKKKATHTKLV